MDAFDSIFDKHCEIKLTSHDSDKLLEVICDAYKNILKQYISTICTVLKTIEPIDRSVVTIDPITMTHQYISGGLPLYYTVIASSYHTSKDLQILIGDDFYNEFNMSKTRQDGLMVLMRYVPNNKYLCVFRDSLDELFDNNSFFVWEKPIDDQFELLNKSKIQQMSKQTTFLSGLELMLL